MRTFYNEYRDNINRWLVIAGFVLGLYVFLIYAFSYVAPFVIGFVISLILEPLVSFLHNRFKLNRGLLAFFGVAISATLLIFVGTRIVISIFNEATSFIKYLPQLLEDTRSSADSIIGSYHNMVEFVPEDFQYSIESAIDGSINYIAGWATSLVGTGVKTGSGSIVRNFPNVIMSIFFSIISAFFFIKDKQKIKGFIKGKSHPIILSNFKVIRAGVLRALNGYIRAQLIMMSFTAIISITGLTILNYQYALLIGLIIAVLDGLPIFGSGTILIPWALARIAMGDISAAVGLLIVYGIITLTRQMLEPKVLGEQIGIYPLVTLMSIYIGLRVFGVMGFLIGPVIVVTINVLNEAWTMKKTEDFSEAGLSLDHGGTAKANELCETEDEYV